jgi:5'-3' exonuclease
VKKYHILIDGDMLVYTMGYASEQKLAFGDGTSVHTPDLRTAKRLIQSSIAKYLALFEIDPEDTERYTVVLSGSDNWRLPLYPEYKANRKTLVKPLSYKEIREWILTLPNAILVGNGDEADDYCAAMLTPFIRKSHIEWCAGSHDCDCPDRDEYPDYVAVTADKDFFTIPGKIYHISSGRLFEPKLNQTFSFLFFQALAGDRVDGYYGVEWIGKAKAIRLLQAAHLKKTTIRHIYLWLKSQVLKRSGKKGWADFRLCLDMAALRWHNEEGTRGIGLRRVFQHRKLRFEYFLPYYDVIHNKTFGQLINPLGDTY